MARTTTQRSSIRRRKSEPTIRNADVSTSVKQLSIAISGRPIPGLGRRRSLGVASRVTRQREFRGRHRGVGYGQTMQGLPAMTSPAAGAVVGGRYELRRLIGAGAWAASGKRMTGSSKAAGRSSSSWSTWHAIRPCGRGSSAKRKRWPSYGPGLVGAGPRARPRAAGRVRQYSPRHRRRRASRARQPTGLSPRHRMGGRDQTCGSCRCRTVFGAQTRASASCAGSRVAPGCFARAPTTANVRLAAAVPGAAMRSCSNAR